jgi:hypothetical protein
MVWGYVFGFLTFLVILAFLLYIAFSDWDLLKDKREKAGN